MNLFSSKIVQVAAIAAIATITSMAWSQPGGNRGGGGFSMMSAGGMTPDYMLRDLQRFQQGLDLTDEQTMIVEQILRDYDESFRECAELSQESIGNSFRSMRGTEDDPARQQSRELRDQMRSIREKLDSARTLGGEEGMAELQNKLNAELETIRDKMSEQRVEQWQSPERQAAFEEVALLMQDQLRLKRQMCNEFEGDLVAVLNEEQLDLWPPLQRQFVRDRLLPRGRLSGESVDVIGLVEQQDFDDQTLIQLLPVLSTWDETVTTALSARDDQMVENQGLLMSAMRTMDTDAGIRVMKEQARLAESVRDINDMAVQDIVLLLPEDKSSAFDSYAKERGYPRIYRPTRTSRAFQAAMELEGLEPDILRSIVELYDALLIEIAYANDQIYAATHRWEAQEQLDRINRFAQRMTGGNSERAESPIREAEDDRRAIEENYLEQLRLLLTPEQIEELGGLENRQRRDDRSGDRGGNDRGDRGDRGWQNSGGREAFMERFDKDGNGEISESEREEIREYFRNGGSHDFSGGPTGAGGDNPRQ